MAYLRYVPVISFIAFTVKCLVVPSTTFDSVALVTTAGLMAFFFSRDEQQEITELKARVSKLEQSAQSQKDDISAVKASVVGMKMGGIRFGVNGGGKN